MGARVSQATTLGDASFPAAFATGAFIAACSWQPLSGGMMIGGELGRMAKPLRRKPRAEIRWFDGVPEKGLRIRDGSGRNQQVRRPATPGRLQIAASTPLPLVEVLNG
jgi:hypothetical protein